MYRVGAGSVNREFGALTGDWLEGIRHGYAIATIHLQRTRVIHGDYRVAFGPTAALSSELGTHT